MSGDGMKERTTIYVTRGLVATAKSRSINISSLVERSLNDALGVEDDESKLRQKEAELVAALNVIRANLAKYDAAKARAIQERKQLILALKTHKEYYHRKKDENWPQKASWLEQTSAQFGIGISDLLIILEGKE